VSSRDNDFRLHIFVSILRQQLRHQGAVHCGRSALDRQAGLAISQLSIVVAAALGGLPRRQ
jgi:hypothetical protein